MERWQQWTIKAGNHYSSGNGILGTGFSPFISKKKISHRIKFTPSCKYDSSVIDGYNKLFGFSYPAPHTNSARFGWRWYNYKEGRTMPIEIVPYIYDGGTRIIPTFFSDVSQGDNGKLFVNIGDVVDFTIEAFCDKYIFTVANITQGKTYTHTYIRKSRSMFCSFFGTKNFPYFGGESVAPHDVVIEYDGSRLI